MPRRTLKGVVVKKSGDKTYKVEVTVRKPHPLYRKVVIYRKRFLVHSEEDIPVGTKVIIRESRRLSKNKHFVIAKRLDNQEEAKND